MAMETSDGTLDARALLAEARARPAGDAVERADVLEYDLGSLAAFDPSPVDEAAFKSAPEKWLAESARDCTQLLFNRLWATLEGQEGGKAAITLPAPTTALPREKPLPKPPTPTRWAKFAAEKGIVKKKRDRMIYDELQQKWMPRYGYKRHNSDDADWLIPAKPSDKPGSDPFEEKAQLKAEQRGRQLFNEERNRRAAKRSTSGAGAAAAAAAVAPVGVPEARAAMPSKEQRLKQSDGALHVAQRATASLGKFDRKLANEPNKARATKRKFEPNLSHDLQDEKSKGLKVIDKLLKAGGVQIDTGKAARIGQVAYERSKREERTAGEGGRGGRGGGRERGGSGRGSSGGRGGGGKSGKGNGRSGGRGGRR